MKTILLLAAVALACAAGASTARAAGDPSVAVKVDIVKLVADATTLHDAVKADADKITADVTALQGTTDRKAALVTLRADWQKVQSDRQQLVAPLRADWTQLKTDLEALRSANAGSADLRTLVQQMRQALSLQRDAVKQSLRAAHQAAQALRSTFKRK